MDKPDRVDCVYISFCKPKIQCIKCTKYLQNLEWGKKIVYVHRRPVCLLMHLYPDQTTLQIHSPVQGLDFHSSGKLQGNFFLHFSVPSSLLLYRCLNDSQWHHHPANRWFNSYKKEREKINKYESNYAHEKKIKCIQTVFIWLITWCINSYIQYFNKGLVEAKDRAKTA